MFYFLLIFWCIVAWWQIFASEKWTMIRSRNGLSHFRHQAINSTRNQYRHITYWPLRNIFQCNANENNGHDSVSNYQPHDCLFNRLFRRRSKKISKLRVTGLCARNSPQTGEFPAQMASIAENVSIWWRHHASAGCLPSCSGLGVPTFYVLRGFAGQSAVIVPRHCQHANSFSNLYFDWKYFVLVVLSFPHMCPMAAE